LRRRWLVAGAQRPGGVARRGRYHLGLGRRTCDQRATGRSIAGYIVDHRIIAGHRVNAFKPGQTIVPPGGGRKIEPHDITLWELSFLNNLALSDEARRANMARVDKRRARIQADAGSST
jgi:hypothetical protein